MSRITGSDAFGLMEAYNNVYTPQELTEEQVWEEVEAWVNSLVEEGYDLSEYTWEDMYEEYLNENQLFKDIQANAGRIGGAISGATGAANRTLSGINRALVNRVTPKRPMPGLPASAAQPGGPASNRVGSVTSRFAGSRDAAFDKARQIQGSPVVGPRTTAQAPARPAAQAPATPARPSTTPARPAITPTSQKPTARTPVAKPTVPNLPGLAGTGALSSTSAPARQSLAQQRADLQKMRIASQMRQAGQNVVSTQLAHFDPFDVVKGHLIDEGYADTEEAALQIMANMSEEWRGDIIEAEVLAPKGGVAGSVQVKQTKTPGFLGTGIGSKTISKPIPGTWTRETPGRRAQGPRSFDAYGSGSRGAEAEMKDRSGPTDAERSRFNQQLTNRFTVGDKSIEPSPRSVNRRSANVGNSGLMPERINRQSTTYQKPNQSWRGY